MNTIPHLAEKEDTQEVVGFFEKYLDENNDWIFSQEFLCPFWIKWAIIRNEIIIIREQGEIIWALRFYKQKRENIVSLYQFAVAESWRWKNIVIKMLKFINSSTIHSRCSKEAKFNQYYIKSGRSLYKEDDLWNKRELKV